MSASVTSCRLVSVALTLQPGKWDVHVHRTIHPEGPREALDDVARLNEIEAVFAR